MSVNGNNVATWLGQHGWAVLIALLMLAGTFAVNVDRTNGGQARDDALSARLNSQEQTIGDVRERLLRVEINDKSQDAARAASQAERDARAKARDDQFTDISAQIRELQATDRETGQWRAALTERLANLTEKLVGLTDRIERLTAQIEQRLPATSTPSRR